MVLSESVGGKLFPFYRAMVTTVSLLGGCFGLMSTQY
jgi:hypothetical protein